jgi:hypothetical protein
MSQRSSCYHAPRLYLFLYVTGRFSLTFIYPSRSLSPVTNNSSLSRLFKNPWHQVSLCLPADGELVTMRKGQEAAIRKADWKNCVFFCVPSVQINVRSCLKEWIGKCRKTELTFRKMFRDWESYICMNHVSILSSWLARPYKCTTTYTIFQYVTKN